MKHFKLQFLFLASLTLALGLWSCSKDNDEPLTPTDPTSPSGSTVPLTQFEVLLDNQHTQGKTKRTLVLADFPETEEFNNPKTAFSAGDRFIFSYNNALQSSQKAYAYSADGKSWTIHEKEDPNSPIKTIELDANSPALSASYLSITAINAGADKDGIVTENGTDGKLVVGCFDALSAIANVTVNNNKATATIPFRHVNHLLNFYIRGTINENKINRLELSITYSNASGMQQNATLQTSSRAEYADIEGKKHTVIQAIVPRNGVVKNTKAILHDNKEITLTNAVNIDCPAEKSHLVTLNVNENVMSPQVGSLINNWAFSGEMNPDGSPVGDIYIKNEAELRSFAEAVSKDPDMPAARINNILAYTANVVQTADIDLSNLAWRPIGGNSYNDGHDITYFAGTYNGNGYKISGMKVTTYTASGHSEMSFAGLFGNVVSPVGGHAILTNIHLVDADIEINEPINEVAVGALAGYAYAPINHNPVIISQCSAKGKISATNTAGYISAGGLVGETNKVHITGSNSNVSIVTNAGKNSYAGGIIGRAISSVVASSYSQNTVSSHSNNTFSSWAGGIVGILSTNDYFSYVIACSSDSHVTSNGNKSYAGGLVGENGGNITGCYARGKVTATGTTPKRGALVGNNTNALNLCYGTSEGGAGNSGVDAIANNIVYNATPTSGNILSIISGEAWKTANGGTQMQETVIGGVLTTIPVNMDGKLIQQATSRLWVLSTPDVWISTGSTNAVYPLPAVDYKGE